ncbi:ComEA family DNA-binding protein [Alteromonas sp. a30]|uniref:ComEA family DNA-binding protein n=1 Tax=Alteromonas sp. a30 TaxID=2730917 RepID=UPI0022803F98|nr:ComEA family DNA-binding protein [Alteromonas sp. a30]MCY7294342.1 ComEA family DNA-binding protein [Alteromonas sp. a30]
MKKHFSAIITFILLQLGVLNPAFAADSNTQSVASVGAEQSNLINLNTATEAQLKSLPGIGPKKAKAIVEYREAFGNFTSVDSVTKVKGVGNKLLSKFRDKIEV